MWTLALYFAAGIVYDILETLYYVYVVDGKTLHSSITSIVWTFFAYTVLYFLILTPNAVMNIFAYAFGCGVGTGLVVWRRGNNNADDLGSE
jgi:uncharacterized protein YebE (UPF0316 family)